MISLYVTSLESGDGKTTFSAGIARLFQEANKKVGFLKPVIAGPDATGNGYVDPDASFLQKALSLAEPAGSVNVIAPADQLKSAFQKAASALESKIDILVVEGLNLAGKNGALAADLAKSLPARVILVARHNKDISPEKLIQAAGPVKDRLLGVIINGVPKSRLDKAKEGLAAPIEKASLRVLAMVPEDRVLFSVSVGDLAEALNGKVLVNANRMDAIAENFMLGAMTLESGKNYFNRKSNKVAIIRGERPDMMLAALHTSTVGIIATGDVKPSDQPMLEAEVKKVPVISVAKPTAEVAAAVEKVLAGARFRQVKKLDRLADILGQTLDFKALSKSLNVN